MLVVHRVCLCVSFGSQNKQQLFILYKHHQNTYIRNGMRYIFLEVRTAYLNTV
jgi:hypothetical protein